MWVMRPFAVQARMMLLKASAAMCTCASTMVDLAVCRINSRSLS